MECVDEFWTASKFVVCDFEMFGVVVSSQDSVRCVTTVSFLLLLMSVMNLV